MAGSLLSDDERKLIERCARHINGETMAKAVVHEFRNLVDALQLMYDYLDVMAWTDVEMTDGATCEVCVPARFDVATRYVLKEAEVALARAGGRIHSPDDRIAHWERNGLAVDPSHAYSDCGDVDSETVRPAVERLYRDELCRPADSND